MPTIPRSTHHWLLLLVVDVTVPAVAAWKHRVGEVSTTVALTSALLSLLILNAVIVLGVRSRNKSLGQDTPRGFYVGATCLVFLSGLLSAVALDSTAERNDYLELAFSDTPLDEIQPKQKALVVELVRRHASDTKEYERGLTNAADFPAALLSRVIRERECDSFRITAVQKSV